MLDREMAAQIRPEERQPDTRHPGIGLVLRLENCRHSRRFDHRAELVGAAAEDSREVASHVFWVE